MVRESVKLSVKTSAPSAWSSVFQEKTLTARGVICGITCVQTDIWYILIPFSVPKQLNTDYFLSDYKAIKHLLEFNSKTLEIFF